MLDFYTYRIFILKYKLPGIKDYGKVTKENAKF